MSLKNRLHAERKENRENRGGVADFPRAPAILAPERVSPGVAE